MRVAFIFRLFLFFLALSNWVVSEGWSSERFVDNKDGTITDTLMGIVWIKDPETIPTLRGNLGWTQARDACDELVYAGIGPKKWRLPVITELRGLVDETVRTPRIDQIFGALGEPYWTSVDSNETVGSKTWAVDFKDGGVDTYNKTSLVNPVKLRARCCRESRLHAD